MGKLPRYFSQPADNGIGDTDRDVFCSHCLISRNGLSLKAQEQIITC